MKCTLCDKEFPEDINDFDLVQHFINEHKKEVRNIGKDILKTQSQKLKKKKTYKSVQHNDNSSKL